MSAEYCTACQASPCICDIFVLARSIVALCRDSKYTEEQLVARAAVIVEQVKSAALEDVFEPMREMQRAGALVSLIITPSGAYSCKVMVPEDNLNFSGRGRGGNTPAEAVSNAHQDWLAAQGPSEEPQEIENGL